MDIKPSKTLSELDLNNLVEAYIRLWTEPQKDESTSQTSERKPIVAYADSWADELINELTSENPDVAWKFIQRVVSKTENSYVLEILAAGPLEGLLSAHGEYVIERVESEAANNPQFRSVLALVWQNLMADSIWERVKKASPEGDMPSPSRGK